MVDVLTSAPVSNKADRTFLIEVVGERSTNPVQDLKTN